MFFKLLVLSPLNLYSEAATKLILRHSLINLTLAVHHKKTYIFQIYII